MRWIIYIGDFPQHVVVAEDEARAIAKWCDEQGYETLDQAAAEFEGMTGHDIRAVSMDL